MVSLYEGGAVDFLFFVNIDCEQLISYLAGSGLRAAADSSRRRYCSFVPNSPPLLEVALHVGVTTIVHVAFFLIKKDPLW